MKSCNCKNDLLYFEDDKLRDECGVIGIYEPGSKIIGKEVYLGLHALQHRGQESAGIAANDDGQITCHKALGLVTDVFDEAILDELTGSIAIGHVRHASSEAGGVVNAQPLVLFSKGGAIALAHNGCIANARTLRSVLESQGSVFHTDLETEVFATVIAKHLSTDTMTKAIKKACETIVGAYAMVITSGNKLIGVRDPNGIRPLCIGKTENGYVLSSESCAFTILGAELVRDVEPGEIVIIENGELTSVTFGKNPPRRVCGFEYVYFARSDSIIDNVSVYKARLESGRVLAREDDVEADVVMSVPDSGNLAAIGYAKESGIPYVEGLLKNRYTGRKFIQLTHEIRDLAVKMKLTPIVENIKGKRLVVVDDSIIRGTTSGKIIRMLRDAGAAEIHLRIVSPPVAFSCYMGIDTPSRRKLMAANYSVKEMCEKIGADSLRFISPEGLISAIGLGDDVCKACFNGSYPTELPDIENSLASNKESTIVGEYD